MGRIARRHSAAARPRLALYAFPPAHTVATCRADHRLSICLLLLASVAGSRLLARALIERLASGLVARDKEVLVVGADAAEL